MKPPASPPRRRHLVRAAAWAAGSALGAAGVGAAALTWPLAAQADEPLLAPTAPPEVAGAPVSLTERGRGRLTVLGLHVYDARLWVTEGFDAAAFDQVPLALELVYARRLVGRQIAERSLKEMKRVPGIEPAQADSWLSEMKQAFPDLAARDRLTGLLSPRQGVRFFHNGALRREVVDADFARRFIGIWLKPQTSQPRLRKALLGGAG